MATAAGRGVKVTLTQRGGGRSRGRGAGPIRTTSDIRQSRVGDRAAGVISRRGAPVGGGKRVGSLCPCSSVKGRPLLM
jgi:hypothetical protein